MTEIDLKLNLDFEQVKVLDHHSLLNILNVIVYELMTLHERRPGQTELESVLEEVHAVADGLAGGTLAQDTIFEVGGIKEKVLHAVEQLDPNGEEAFRQARDDTHANLRSIFNVLDLRIRELRDRYEHPLQWEWFSSELLEGNLRAVFNALAHNSRGRFGFTEDPDSQRPNDYLIQLRVEGGREDAVFMPPVIQDVVRDLAANARKYSEPGGTIWIRVFQDSERLEFELRDTGIGIPADEIPGILRFGHRGSNIRGKRTMGGGFGLTKAYYVVQMFGGKMWMESSTEAPTGTTIRCCIPLPGRAEACCD